MLFSKKKNEFDNEIQNARIISTIEDLSKFVVDENPYKDLTDFEKNRIPNIGTSLNVCLRNGYELPPNVKEENDLFQSLIKRYTLKKSIVVNRGQDSVDYEIGLANNRGLSDDYMYYDGYVYTALIKVPLYQRKNQLRILVPKGTHYLFTGINSNITANQSTDNYGELVLDVGTVLHICKKTIKGNVTYIDAVVKQSTNFQNSL